MFSNQLPNKPLNQGRIPYNFRSPPSLPSIARGGARGKLKTLIDLLPNLQDKKTNYAVTPTKFLILDSLNNHYEHSKNRLFSCFNIFLTQKIKLDNQFIQSKEPFINLICHRSNINISRTERRILENISSKEYIFNNIKNELETKATDNKNFITINGKKGY